MCPVSKLVLHILLVVKARWVVIRENAIRVDVTELTPFHEHFQSARTSTPSSIHETSLAPCWRKEVCHRKLMYMKLASCMVRERCKVLSSKSRRWLGQEASIGQDASIRDVAEVGWKWRNCITWWIALNDRQLCIGNCAPSNRQLRIIRTASWVKVKEWQVESPVASLIPLLLLSCSVHDVIISNVILVRLFRDALIFKHLGTSSLFPSCSDTFLLTSMPSFAASQGLAPWATAHVSRSMLTFSTWQEECDGLLSVSLSFSWSRHMIGHRLHRFPFAECVEEGCRRGKIFKIPNLWLLKICKSNYVNQKRHK